MRRRSCADICAMFVKMGSLIAISMLLWLVPSSSAEACSCAPPPENIFENVDLAIVATSLAVDDETVTVACGEESYEFSAITLRVDEVIKGSAGPEIRVLAEVGTSCGQYLPPGSQWILFPDYSWCASEELFLGGCSGNRPAEGNDEFLEELRSLASGHADGGWTDDAGSVPADASVEERQGAPPRNPSCGCVTGSPRAPPLGLIGVLGGVLVVCARSRRPAVGRPVRCCDR